MTDFITRRRISQEWERKRKADFVAYSQARSIVVLADAADVPVLHDMARQWDIEGKKVTWVIRTVARPSIESPLPGTTLYICRRCMGWLPLPSKREIEQFDTIEADVLIDLSPKHPAMQFLAARSGARMKIGVVDTMQRNEPYDLAIRCNDNPGVVLLLQDMLFYWGKIGGDTPDDKENA